MIFVGIDVTKGKHYFFVQNIYTLPCLYQTIKVPIGGIYAKISNA